MNEIVIDTNVFEHLINRNNNKCNHIEILLTELQKQKYTLVLDAKGLIWSEYKNTLSFFDKPGIISNYDYLSLYEYWLNPELFRRVSVDCSDDLMRSIELIVLKRKGKPIKPDRILVYVAISVNRTLLTNDKRDIVCGPNRVSCLKSKNLLPFNNMCERRNELLKIAIKRGSKDARIYTSEEAHKNFV